MAGTRLRPEKPDKRLMQQEGVSCWNQGRGSKRKGQNPAKLESTGLGRLGG